MSKFFRKYYQEVIALLLIAGFWTGVWAYHSYQAKQADFRAAHTFEFSPDITGPNN